MSAPSLERKVARLRSSGYTQDHICRTLGISRLEYRRLAPPVPKPDPIAVAREELLAEGFPQRVIDANFPKPPPAKGATK